MCLKSGRGVVILVLCGVLLSACSREKPDLTVTAFFDALQKGDLKTAEEYVDAPIFADVEGDEVVFLQKYFNSFSYEKPIIESMKSSEAVVGVTITALDLRAVMTSYVETIIKKAAADRKMLDEYSETELNNILLNMLDDKAAPKKTLKLSLELTRHEDQGNKWMIAANEQLRSGLFTAHSSDVSLDSYPNSESRDISANAALIGIDKAAGICKFTVDKINISIICTPEYADFLKERVGETFPILYRVDSRPGEKESYRLIGFE
ncbi:MAG: hypothetical protein LBP51_00670 [Deferribacteraceae bacterium]|jgi:hypothetical protein|nr:hypothetical protein [Deferribacteraceae bacterium]